VILELLRTLNGLNRMKKSQTTKLACKSPIIVAVCLACLSPLWMHAQSPESAKTEASLRPAHSDSASLQLIDNFFAVSGGKQAYIKLRNVTATGTILEAGHSKSFELIETLDGCRQLTYTWKHLGRTYKKLYSFDGVDTWQQDLLPKEEYPEAFTGRKAQHFARQHWLLQPFVLPLLADFTFKYQGESKVAGRPSYLITGFGKNNTRSWFYFDKERSLLTRWGGKGMIASTEEYMDYQATKFATVNEVLLPQEIELLAENSPFGTITIDSIVANRDLDPKIFYMPPNTIPTLRQVLP
jgi:hypothetical protein